MPVQRLRQHAADQEPDRAPGGRDERVHAHRGAAFAGVGEHRDDDSEDHRGHERGGCALHESRDDQQRRAVGEAAQQRRHGERRDPRDEDPLAPDDVAHSPGQ